MNNQTARINMVTQQLRTNAILDETILALYDQVPRHHFLPEALSHFAYSDMQIPLAHDQRMFTPLEEATILQALQLTGNETVLEVGTGTGFFTALLSQLSKQVISIDYYAEFTSTAQKQLKKHNCNNVDLITGDGCRGVIERAPYDVMVLTGAIEALTETHRLQILPGGKIVAIEGEGHLMQARLYTLNPKQEWVSTLLFETNIPPLIDQLKTKEFVF